MLLLQRWGKVLGADSLIVCAGKLWFLKSDEILRLRGLSQRQIMLCCSLAEFEWGKEFFFPPCEDRQRAGLCSPHP